MKKLMRGRVVPTISACVFLADLGFDRLRLTILAKIRKKKQCSCQALFAGIEQLIDQILFSPILAGQQMGREYLAKGRLGMEDADHLCFPA